MSTINRSDLRSILARYGVDSPTDLKDLLPYLKNKEDTSIPQDVRDTVSVTTPDSTPGTLSDTELGQIQTALTTLYSGPAPVGASKTSTAFSKEVNFLMTGVGTTSAPYISSNAKEVQSSMSIAGNDLQNLIDNPPQDWYVETPHTYTENGETITVKLKTIKADKLADYYNAVMSKLNRLLTLFTTTNALLQTRAKAAREWSEADLDDDLKQKLEEGRKDYEKNKRHLSDSVSNLQKKTLEGVQKMISKMFEMVQKANAAEITKALNDIDKKWRSTGQEHDNEKTGDYDVNRANLKEKVTAGAAEAAKTNFQQMGAFNQRVTQIMNMDAIGLGSAAATSLKNTIETDLGRFRNAGVTKDSGAIFRQTVGKDSGADSFVDYDMDFMLKLRTKLNLYQNLVRTVVNANVAVLNARRQAAVALQNARVSQETDSVIGNSIGAMEATFSKQTSALEMLHMSAMQYVHAFNTHKQAEIDLEKAKETAKIKKNSQIITWVVTAACVIVGALLCAVPGLQVFGVGLMVASYSIGSAAGDVYKNSAMADMEKSFDQEFFNPETVKGIESQIKLEAAQTRLRTLEEKRKNGTLTSQEQNEYYIVNSEVALYRAEAEFRDLGSLIITGGDKMQAEDSARLAQANKRIAVQHNKIRLIYAIAKSIQEAKENALVMAFGIGKTGSMGKYQNQLEGILSTEMSLFSDLENELQTRVQAHNQNTAKDKRIYDYTVNMIFAAVNLVLSFASAFMGPGAASAMGVAQGGLGMIQTSITNKWGPYAGAKASYKDADQLKREHEAYNPGPKPDPGKDPQAYLDWQERNIMYQMTDPDSKIIRDSGDGAFGENYAEVDFAKIAGFQKQMMVVQMQRMVITMLQASVMKAMQSAIKLAFGISSSGVALNDAMTMIDTHNQAQNASFGHMVTEFQTRVDVHNRITAANIEWAIGMVTAGIQMLLSAASGALGKGAGKAAQTAAKVLRTLTPLLVTAARLAMRLSLYINHSQNRYTTDIRSSILDTAGDNETVDPSKTRTNPNRGSGQGSNLGLDESAIIATAHGSVTMDYSRAVQTQWRIEIQTRILELVKDIQMAFLESEQKAIEYFSDIDTNSSYRSAMSMIRSASNAEKQITDYASKQLHNKVTSVNRRQDALRAAIKEAITAAIQIVIMAITAAVDKASKKTGAGSKPTDKTTGIENQGSFKLDVAKLAVALSEISTDLLATVIAVEVIDANADNEYRKEGISKDAQTLSEIENNTNTGKVSVGNKNTGSWENQLISAEIISANAQAVGDINMMARLRAQMLAQALISFENKMADTVITKGIDKAIHSDAAKKLAFGKNIPFLSEWALRFLEASLKFNDIKQNNPLDNKGRDARVAQHMKQMEDSFNQKQQMQDLYKVAHSPSTTALSQKAVTSLNSTELDALKKSLEAAENTPQLSDALKTQIIALKTTVTTAQSATYETLTQMETQFKAIISSLLQLQSDALAEITSATVALNKETAAMAAQSDRIRADSKQASEIHKAHIAGANAPPANLFSEVTQTFTFSFDSKGKGVVTEVAAPYKAAQDPASGQSPRQVPLFLAASGHRDAALNQTETPKIMVLVSESDMADPVALQKTISEAVRSKGVPVEDMLFIPATDSKTQKIVAKPLLAAPHAQVDDAVQQISKATAQLKEISSVLSSLQEAIPFLTEMTHHANAAKLAVLSNLVSQGEAAQAESTTAKAAKTELDTLMKTINSESGLGDLDAQLTSAKNTLAKMADQLAKISQSVQAGTLTLEQSKSISTAQKSVAEVQKDVGDLVDNLTRNHKESIKQLIRNLIQPSRVGLTTGRGFTDMNWRLAREDRAETTNNILKQLQKSPGTETPSEVAAHMFFEDIQGLIGDQLTHNEARKGFGHTQRSLAFQSQLEKKDLDVAFSIAKLSTAVSTEMAADTMLVLMQRLDGAQLKDHIPRLIQALATIDPDTAAEIVKKMTERATGPQKALLLSALTNASMGPLTSGTKTAQQRYKDSSSFAFERPFERAFKDSTYQKNAQKMMESINLANLATSIRPEDMVESDFLATLSKGYSESNAAKEQTHAIMADILKQATQDATLQSKLTPKAIAAYETEKAQGPPLSKTSVEIDALITTSQSNSALKSKFGAMAIAFAFANKTGTLEMLKPFVTDLNAEVTTISASIQEMDRLATRPPSSLLTPSKTSDLLEAIKENIEALPRDIDGKLTPDSAQELRKALPAIAIAVAEKLKVPNGTPSAVGFIENLRKRVPEPMHPILMEALAEAITSSPEKDEIQIHLKSFAADIPSTRTLLLTTMSAQVAGAPSAPLSTIQAQTQMNGHMAALIQRIHSAQPHEVLGLLRQNPGLSAAIAKGLEGSPKLTADLLLRIDQKTTGSTAIRAEFSRQIAADVQRLNRNTTTPPITAKSIQSNIPMGGSLAGDIIRDIQKASDLGAAQLFLDNTEGQAAKLAAHHLTNPSDTLKLFNDIVLLNPIKASNIIIGLAAGTPQQAALVKVLLDAAGEQIKQHMPPENLDQISRFLTAVEYQAARLEAPIKEQITAQITAILDFKSRLEPQTSTADDLRLGASDFTRLSQDSQDIINATQDVRLSGAPPTLSIDDKAAIKAKLATVVGQIALHDPAKVLQSITGQDHLTEAKLTELDKYAKKAQDTMSPAQKVQMSQIRALAHLLRETGPDSAALASLIIDHGTQDQQLQFLSQEAALPGLTALISQMDNPAETAKTIETILTLANENRGNTPIKSLMNDPAFMAAVLQQTHQMVGHVAQSKTIASTPASAREALLLESNIQLLESLINTNPNAPLSEHIHLMSLQAKTGKPAKTNTDALHQAALTAIDKQINDPAGNLSLMKASLSAMIHGNMNADAYQSLATLQAKTLDELTTLAPDWQAQFDRQIAATPAGQSKLDLEAQKQALVNFIKVPSVAPTPDIETGLKATLSKMVQAPLEKFVALVPDWEAELNTQIDAASNEQTKTALKAQKQALIEFKSNPRGLDPTMEQTLKDMLIGMIQPSGLQEKSLSTLVGMLPDLETKLDAQITAAAGTPLHAELTQQKATLMALKALTRQALTAERDMAGYQDAMLTALSTAASPPAPQALAADLERLSNLVTSQKANRQLETLFTQLQHSDTKVLDPTQLKEAHIEPLRKILESATLRTQLKAGNPEKYAQLMIVLAQFEANQPNIPPKTLLELTQALTDAEGAKTLTDQHKATNVRDLQTARGALAKIKTQLNPPIGPPVDSIVLAQLQTNQAATLANIQQLEASGPDLDTAVAAAKLKEDSLAIRTRIAALVPDSAEAKELAIARAILPAYTQFSKAITVDDHAAFVETFCDLNPKEQGEFLLAINSQFTHFSDLATLPPVSQALVTSLKTLKQQLPAQANFDRLADAGVVDKLQTLLTRFQENDVTHIQELQKTCAELYTKASTGDPITQTLHQIGEKIRVIAPRLIDRGLFRADELEELLSQTGEPGHELLSLVTILTKITTESAKLPKEWAQPQSPTEKPILSTLGEAKIALGKTLMHELITNPDINADQFKEPKAAAKLKSFFTMAAQEPPGSDPPLYPIANALDQALLKHSAVEKYQRYFAPADAATGQSILEHTGRYKTLEGLKIAIEQLNGKTTPIVALINHIDDFGLRERVIGDLLDDNFTEGLHVLSAVTTSDPAHMKQLQELVWQKTHATNPGIDPAPLGRIFAAIQIGLGDTLFASSMQGFLNEKMRSEDPAFTVGFDAAIRDIRSMDQNSALPDVTQPLPDRSVTYQKMRRISSMIQRLSATSPGAASIEPFMDKILDFITSMVSNGAIEDIEYMLSQFAVTDRSTLSLILKKSPELAVAIKARLKDLTPKTARQLLEYPAIFNAAITMPFTVQDSEPPNLLEMLTEATITKPGQSGADMSWNPNINSEQDLIRRLELTALKLESRKSVLAQWKKQINASDIPTLTARVAAFPELIASITDPKKLESLLIAFKTAGKLQEIKPFIAACTPTLQKLLRNRLLSDDPLASTPFPTTELLNLLENPIQIADMMEALLKDPPVTAGQSQPVTSDQRKNFLTQVLSDPALFRATPHRQLLIQDMVTDLVRNHLDDMTALSRTDSLLPVVKASLHEALLIAIPLKTLEDENSVIVQLTGLGYLPANLREKLQTQGSQSASFKTKLEDLKVTQPDLYQQIGLEAVQDDVRIASPRDTDNVAALIQNMAEKNPPAVALHVQIRQMMGSAFQRKVFFNKLKEVATTMAGDPAKMQAFLIGSPPPDPDAQLMQFYFANTALFEAHLGPDEELSIANTKQQLQSGLLRITPRSIEGREDLFIATMGPLLKNMPRSAQTPAILRHIGACLGQTIPDEYAHTLAEFDKIFTATDDKELKAEVMYHILMSTAKSIANPTESELTAIKAKLTQLQELAKNDPKTHLLLLDITEILLEKHFDLFSVGGDSALHTWFQDYTKHLLTASQLIGVDTHAKKESTSAVLKLFNFATTDYTTKREQRKTAEIQAYLSAAVETGIKGATVGANMKTLIQAALKEPADGAAFMQTVATMINYRASNQKPIWHLYQELLGTKDSKDTLSDPEKASFIKILCDYSSQNSQLLFPNYQPRRIEARRLMRYREDNYLMSYLIANDFHTQSSQIIEAMDYQNPDLTEHVRRQNKKNLITGLGSLGTDKLTDLLLSSSSEAQDNIIDVISKDHTDDKSGNFIFFPERAKAHKKMIADLLAMRPSKPDVKEVLIKLYIRSPQAFPTTETAKMQGHGIALDKIKAARTRILDIVAKSEIHLQGNQIAAVLDDPTIQPNDFFIALQSVNQNESPGILAQVTDTLTDAAAAKGVSIEAFLIGKFHPGEFDIAAFEELAHRLDKDQLFPGHSLSAENLASLTILGEITNQNFATTLSNPKVQQAITSLFSDDKGKLDSEKVTAFMTRKSFTTGSAPLTEATTLITQQFHLHRASTQKGGAFLDAMTELLADPNRQWVSNYLIANQPLFDTLKANIKANTGITIRDSKDLLALDIPATPPAVTQEAQALFTSFNDPDSPNHHNLRTLLQKLQRQFDPANVPRP